MSREIDDETGRLEARLCAGDMSGVPQSNAQAGQQFTDTERLVDIVIRAEVERGNLLSLPVPRRDDDDGNSSECPQPFDDFLPVEIRQAEIEQYGIGGFRDRQLSLLLPPYLQ